MSESLNSSLRHSVRQAKRSFAGTVIAESRKFHASLESAHAADIYHMGDCPFAHEGHQFPDKHGRRKEIHPEYLSSLPGCLLKWLIDQHSGIVDQDIDMPDCCRKSFSAVNPGLQEIIKVKNQGMQC